LDWEGIKSSLSNATAASIDVKSLADRRHNAAFLIAEVARRNATADSSTDHATPARAVIVLSGPMVFDTEQELQGIELKSSADSRVFYIRLQGAPTRQPVFGPDPGRRRGGGFGGYPGRARTPGGDEMPTGMQMDQLEPMLKPLDPHLFDVMTADQFRKALATIMSEISSM
jgi:hypothetical protein